MKKIIMKKDEIYYKILDLRTDALQHEMLKYNEKNHLPIIRKDSRTIEEEENIIINKYGGKKLNKEYFYSHLSDFFGDKERIDFFQIVSPCKIIFAKTQEIIPDKYFHSFYLIPIAKEQKGNINYGKEVIVYITSSDGINVYRSGLMNEYILCSKELIKELESAMAYCAEGIAMYYFKDLDNDKIQKKSALNTDEFPRKMLEYNKKNHLPIIRKDSRTIEEEENIIINKYGGKKLNTEYFYNHLSDFFGDKECIDYYQKVSPCRMIFEKTEIIIPDEYFHSFYLIPIAKEQKGNINYGKEIIAYITSSNGINVYISGLMNQYILCSRELIKELESAMAYCAEGIAVYFEDMQNIMRGSSIKKFLG